MTDLSFFVPGKPVAQGSKRHVGRGIMIESSKHLPLWRNAVSSAAHAAMAGRPLFEGPLFVEIAFFFPMPKSREKKAQGLVLRKTTTPDGDKLMRAMFDAMADIVYRNDSQCDGMFERVESAVYPCGALVRVSKVVPQSPGHYLGELLKEANQ